MRFTRYRLIEYRSGSEEWLNGTLGLSLNGQAVMPNGSMITATEIDAHQITVSLEDALREARGNRDDKWLGRATEEHDARS